MNTTQQNKDNINRETKIIEFNDEKYELFKARSDFPSFITTQRSSSTKILEIRAADGHLLLEIERIGE